MGVSGRLLAASLLCLGLATPILAQDDKGGQDDKQKPQEPVLDDVAELERVARALEWHGLKRLTFAEVDPPRPKLKFVVDKNTVEKEREFYEAWHKAYLELCEGLIEEGTEVLGDDLKEKDRKKEPAKRLKAVLKKLSRRAKQEPAMAERALQLQAALKRYEGRLIAAQKPVDMDKLFTERARKTEAFLKRYDFGERIATAHRNGTAVIEVQLPPDTWNVVQRELDGWKYDPLNDADGKQVELQGMKVFWGQQLKQGAVKTALDQLAHLEYYTVRYAEVNEQVPTGEYARVTGAKLLFGNYTFLQYKQQVIVFRNR